MATPRGKSAREQLRGVEDDAELAASASFDPEQPEDDLARALAELGESGGGRVKVERVSDNRKLLEYVDEFDAAAFSLKELQQQYGGGEYRLTVRDAGGRYVKSGRVMIAQPRQAPGAAPAEPSGGDKLAEVMRAQGEQLQRALALMMLQQRTAPASAVTPDQVRRELLQDMQLMRDLVGGGGQQIGADKLLEVLKLGMEIARDSEGGGDWVSLAAKALDALGEPIKEALTQRAGGSPAPAAAIPGRAPGRPIPAPATAGASPNPQPQQRPREGRMFGAFNLQGAVAFLVAKAAAGADSTLYADLILDNLPPAQLPILQQLLAGDVVESLAAFDPRVRQQAQWFRDLGDELRQMLQESDAAEPGSDAGGDADGNPAGDSAGP